MPVLCVYVYCVGAEPQNNNKMWKRTLSSFFFPFHLAHAKTMWLSVFISVGKTFPGQWQLRQAHSNQVTVNVPVLMWNTFNCTNVIKLYFNLKKVHTICWLLKLIMIIFCQPMNLIVHSSFLHHRVELQQLVNLIIRHLIGNFSSLSI